ncbi:MAG TPA: LacI family DNA-binding transcriptional regulator [Pseudonocardia sp.]|nr:LacI family DNA-binding transcriptional regulator [Pseudonocardia sp.]
MAEPPVDRSSTPRRRTGRPPTIIDVAAKAGVSKSLVSLVLRGKGPPLVSDARRELVLQAVADLGYRPNGMARGLARQRTGLLGVLVSDLRNPFFAELAESVDAEAARRGYRAVLAAGHRHAEREQLVVNDFLESRVEAIVLLSPALSAAAIIRTVGGVPVVIEGRPSFRSSRVDLVGTDDALGAELAVRHLVELGHRKIAHVAGSAPGAEARRKGYERAMRTHRRGQYIQVVDSDETDSGGYEVARRLLDGPSRPSAVFAVNDVVALSVLAAAEDLEIAVPGALSVVGFDDTYLAGLRGVGLTTVAQPVDLIAATMVDALLERIEGSGTRPAVRQWLPPTLTVRSTTAVLPKT